MAVAELHFFAADDLNGSTIYECTTDDPWVEQIEIEPSLSALGHGRVKFARKVGESIVADGVLSSDTLVRVLVPAISTTRYLWGFFIHARSQRVIDKDERGGEYFEFGGPGPKYYLSRAILWDEEYADGTGYPDPVAGVWVWGENAKPGHILHRLIAEDAANPIQFLPDLTKSFNSSNDSDGVPWALDVTVGEDFTLNMGDDYLKLMWTLENLGDLETEMNLGTVAAPLMELEAYQTFGRDLTGAQAADTVHFTEGVNILSEMDVDGDTHLRASHALVRGADGVWEHAERGSWDPGDPVKAIRYDYTVSSNPTILDRAGRRFLRAHEVDGDIELNMQPGWAPADGLYMPGPEGTNGHLWYGDTVSLTTGLSNPSVLDYQSDPHRIMALNMKLAEAVDDSDAWSRAVSWQIRVKFDKERTSNATAPGSGGSGGGGDGGTHANCTCVRLCTTTLETGETATLYEEWTWEAGTETEANPGTMGVGLPGSPWGTGEEGGAAPGAGAEGGVHYSRWMNDGGSVDIAATAGEVYRVTGYLWPYNTDIRIEIIWWNAAGDTIIGTDLLAYNAAWPNAWTAWSGQATCPVGATQFQLKATTGAAGGVGATAWLDQIRIYTIAEGGTSPGTDEYTGTGTQAARCDHGHDHNDLLNRNAADAHTASAVTFDDVNEDYPEGTDTVADALQYLVTLGPTESSPRWLLVTHNDGSGPDLVWEGDELVEEWSELV